MDNEEKKKKLKKIAKIFIAVYLVSFFVINWNDVSWIFNYKAVGGLIDDFFTPYPSIASDYISPTTNFIQNNSANNVQNNNINNQAKFTYSDKKNSLTIPAIGIDVPLVFAQSANKEFMAKYLDQGAVYYPGSVMPWQNGLAVVLGHSAPPYWPKIKHDWIFNDLNKLNVGDKILVIIDNKQYTYSVKGKTIVDREQEIIPKNLTASNNILVLVTCWPPGKDIKRILIEAELEK